MLELEVATGTTGERVVEVAVDAPGGPGPRTYSYLVPASLGPLEPGEPVLVPFGRGGRQAIGVVVDAARSADPGVELRPIAARVRADGPLLPPLALALAGRIADHYLAPLATVIRAMLPPGMLERLELVAG
jgi:primosomal protein N'